MNLERGKVWGEVRCYKKLPNGSLQDLKSGNVVSGVTHDHMALALSLPEHVAFMQNRDTTRNLDYITVKSKKK